MTAHDRAAHDLRRIPLDEIDAAALPRDRSVIDRQPLDELRLSIFTTGLRLPVEVFELPEPRDGARYGLVSGTRRLMCFRELRDMRHEGFDEIPAFLRPAASEAEALAAVVAENELRAGISPWEQGAAVWFAARSELHPNIEAAVDALFPGTDRTKRSRLRALARLVESMEGCFTDPWDLSLRQCMRLERAIRGGFETPIHVALEETKERTLAGQWRAVEPLLAEAEAYASGALRDTGPKRPGRPRRVMRMKQGVTIRRERTSHGWSLHFTGREATTDFMDSVFCEIERVFGAEG